ncbi:hypothetical protein CVT24_006811 [Panaeolus cyanescens]|uniref:Uncharacterized protein n=1 Tax=Panaeolus cyanescens TaxID=181874 RepID=A0A409V9C6_9AGAR|nr:hypothetical protein CVT24_006811 [Panaeolus cyanescens]
MQVPAASALVTGSFAALRGHKHPGAIATASTINSAITASAFFSVRELAISPLLVQLSPLKQHTDQRQALSLKSETGSKSTTPIPNEMSWSSLRTHNLLDSGLSGALVGGVLRGIKSGPRSIPSGSITTGIICTLLQYGYNEITTSRLRYISKLREEQLESTESTPAPNAIPPLSTSQQLLRLIGVSQLSDEDYLAKMKRQRSSYLKRIEELEQQISENDKQQ